MAGFLYFAHQIFPDMHKPYLHLFCFWLMSMAWAGLFAQENEKPDMGSISGSFQSDIQLYFPDSLIGAQPVREKLLSNSFLQLTYQKGRLSAGLRYEAYLNPLLGFDRRYAGQGLANRFVQYSGDQFDVTAGNFYEQFGNGIVFRAYQEWALGIDNSIDGVRVRFRPVPGISITGLTGKQRRFFEYSEGIIRAADATLDLNALIAPLKDSENRLSFGGSFVSRYQPDRDPVFILPENVSAFSGRMRFQRGYFNLDAEAAWKINDPMSRNKYVYNEGSAYYLAGGYSRKGFGVNLSAKRIDNFDFRSERDVSFQESTLSFLPAISKQHTYRLITLYPYATQFNGEAGFAGSLFYQVKRNSKLGGKYGTLITLNYARIVGLDTTFVLPGLIYESTFAGGPELLYFEDANVEINRKWNKSFTTILTYAHLKYNKDIVEFGTPTAGFGTVVVNFFALEGQYKVNATQAVRAEVQWMQTKQDLGSWVMGLVEYSIAPRWYFTLFNEYNYGNSNPDRQVHYYNGQVAFNHEGYRISLGYGRQRAGLLCVGGICRVVPASNGFTLSMNATF